MWMKRKLVHGKPALSNLAISGVATEFANNWQKDVLVRRASEIVERSAESNQFGLESLKRAIRAAYKLSPDREIVTSLGASGGYRLVCEMLLAARTDAEVILESPVYEPLRAIPEHLGVKLQSVSRPGDVAEFARSVNRGTRAIVLSNLHNPTGHWFSYEELARLATTLDAIGSRALVVVDETFLDIGPHPGTSAAGLHPRIITISSLSKSHGLPMLRCGWITADTRTLPSVVEDAVLFQNIGGKLAEVQGAMAMEEIDDFRQSAREHLANNRRLMVQWLAEMSHAGLIAQQDLPPGCIVFPRIHYLGSTTTLVERLEEQFDVLVAPGLFFGDAFDDRIRIGFGGDRENLKRGLARLADGLVAIRRHG
jgi:aspartate/methionine/tyrosine aminotransferase